MTANLLSLFLVRGEQTAVRGPQDPTPASPVFYERNSYKLRLHSQRRNPEPGSLTRFIEDDFTGYTEFEASLGYLDAKPTGGTWKIKLTGGSFSADLAFDISAANLETAIRALSGAGNVTVTNGNATNIYIIRPASLADDLTFETQLSLIPLCSARIRKATDGSGNYTVLKLSKAYFANATVWESPMPPETTVEVQSVGSSTKNTLQLITVPVGATGSFRLQHASMWTAPIAVAGLTPAAVATALNALYSDGTTSPRFAAYGTATGIQIECIGTLEKTSVAEFGIELLGQVALPVKEAWFHLTTLPLEMEVAAKTKVPMVFEVVGRDADGREETLFQKTVDVFNVIHESDTSETIATVATNYVEVVQTADPDAPIQIGLRSAELDLTGSGTSPSDGTYEQTFTHNLNTLVPVIIGFRRTSVSPEKWEQMTDNEFTATTISVNGTKIFMPVIPSEPGNVGSVKIYAINPAAAVWTNDHRHETDVIDGVGARAGKTLTEILDELEASLPSEWPSVPGNALVDNSVKPGKIDLAALAAALFANAEFMALLRAMGTDTAFVKSIATTLASSTLATERASLFTEMLKDVLTSTELQTALLTALTSSRDFISTIYTAVLTALTGGATITANAFTMPSLDVYYPAPSTSTQSGRTVTFFRSLPIAYQTTTDGGSVSSLPASPTAGYRYTLTADAVAAENDYATSRRFKSGTVVVWNGYFFQPVKVITVSGTDRYYPADFERTVFETFLDNARFRASSVATLSATLQTQLQSPEDARIRARALLVIEVGTGGSASGATNLSTMTWQTAVEHELNIGPELAFTPIVLTATRPASGDITWALKINGASAAFTLGTGISNGACAIRARITRFDTEDSTPPLGALLLKCPAPGGSIASL